MQRPLISLSGILSALSLDMACIALLEQTTEFTRISNAQAPEEVYQAIRTIGNILDARPQAELLADNLEERINIIRHKLKFIADEHKPNVLCLYDVSPIEIAQNDYLDHLVKTAGGNNYFDVANNLFNPDIIILINDKPVPQLLSELPTVLSMRDWSQTNAVKNNNVYVVYDGKYLRGPGATIADDTEILAEIINPQYFIFGRNGEVWMPFDMRA